MSKKLSDKDRRAKGKAVKAKRQAQREHDEQVTRNAFRLLRIVRIK